MVKTIPTSLLRLYTSYTMESELATSPLEFQDDYFATNLSSDDVVDSSADEARFIDPHQQQALRKTTSIISLGNQANGNTGIMFKELRTVPMNSISLENVSLNRMNGAENSTNDDVLSVNQADDTASTILSPIITAANITDDVENEPTANSDLKETGFPFVLNECLEYSDDSDNISKFFGNRQHFFMLSSAGKPIYCMHGSYDIFVVYSGVIQTIVSFYKYSSNGSKSVKIIECKDKKTGQPIKFVFLDKSPIILMTIVRSNQSTYIELEQQLDFIYSFILSALSKPYIDKLFGKYANFDLRNLLGKTDVLTLDSICEGFANNLNVSQVLGGLQCLRMHLSIRSRLERKLMNFRSENLLYGLIVGPNEKLISIMRPKRHTLHTSDLMILFEMIFNTNTFKTKSDDKGQLKFITSETFWVPICLPKFNSSGHLYNLIQFHQLKDERLFKLHDIKDTDDLHLDEDSTKIGIILMSPYKDTFNEMRKISNEIAKTILFDHKIYRNIWSSLVGNGRIVVDKIIGDKGNEFKENVQGSTAFSSLINKLSLNSPKQKNLSDGTEPWSGILHFAVRSKRSVQCIFPESVYFDINDEKVRRNLLNVYKYLRHRLHVVWTDTACLDFSEGSENIVLDGGEAAGGSNTVIYEDWYDEINEEKILGFGCKFGTYEVFIIGKGTVTESDMLAYGLKVVKWVRKQDSRIFISTGCIF